MGLDREAAEEPLPLDGADDGRVLDILVPFWGDPELLRRTIESVLAQTSGDWRLTVVDDAYPDESVATYFAGLADERIRYVRNEANVGITENYRRCLALAESELMVFMGCDDIMLPRYVETVLAVHSAFPEADVVQPGVEVIDGAGRTIVPLGDRVKTWLRPRASAPRLLSGESLAASLIRGNWLYWPSLTFRRAAVERHGFRDGLPIIQDLALLVDIVSAGGRLLYVPEVCFQYRRHGASASSSAASSGKRFDGERRYFALAERQAVGNGWPRAARAARWHLSSRALALALLPQAVRARDRAARATLLRFAFERPTTSSARAANRTHPRSVPGGADERGE
mgnify:CR=1 FL=1